MPQVSTRIRRGLPSFFKPSRELVREFLSLIALPNLDFTNEELIEKAKRDISVCLWRYFGTLARESARNNVEREVSRATILEGMSVRFNLPPDSKPVVELWEEFDPWLQCLEDCSYYAPWGEIRSIPDGVLVKGLRLEKPSLPKRDYTVEVYQGLSEEEFLKHLAPE